MTPHNVSTRTRGSVSVLAVFLLAIFAAMAVGYARVTDMNNRMSGNAADLQNARLAAESGLSFGIRTIRAARLPDDTDNSNVIANLVADLAGQLNGSGNLNGSQVTLVDGTVYLPPIRTQNGAFEIRIMQTPDQVIHLQSMGYGEMARHLVSLELTVVTEPSNTAFDYGIASMGPVVLDGNAQIRGMNLMTEASVISVTENDVAIRVGGTAWIDGDLFSAGADTSVVLNGTPTIAGTQDIM